MYIEIKAHNDNMTAQIMGIIKHFLKMSGKA